MIKSAKLILVGLLAAASLVFSGGAPVLASATDPCSGTTAQEALECGGSGGNSIDPAQANKGVNGTLDTVINIFSVVAGVLSVIMIIIAGYRYITSGGSQDKVTSAKQTLTYAIIGIIVVVLAQTIAQFVLGRATQATKKTSFNSSIREA